MFAVGWISYQNAEWGILPFGSFYGEVERPQFDTCLFRRFVAYYVDNSKSKSQYLRFLLYTAIRFFFTSVAWEAWSNPCVYDMIFTWHLGLQHTASPHT